MVKESRKLYTSIFKPMDREAAKLRRHVSELEEEKSRWVDHMEEKIASWKEQLKVSFLFSNHHLPNRETFAPHCCTCSPRP
jgi:hypothetical protein